MNFAGKVVLITGASSGIGAAAAKQFAKLGASLALSGRNLENLSKVSEECVTAGAPKPYMVTGELTQEKDVKNILEQTIKHYGKLDVLVNNAGIIETGSIENTSLEQFDRMMNINVRCVYQLTQLAVPHLIKTKGNIVNVSSVNGIRSFPGVLAYCMSKSALDQFTRCVALELATKEVRCNSVNPGVTVTNLHKRGGMNEEQYEQFLKRTKETHAMGRPGDAVEVADTIVFLASGQASFVTVFLSVGAQEQMVNKVGTGLIWDIIDAVLKPTRRPILSTKIPIFSTIQPRPTTPFTPQPPVTTSTAASNSYMVCVKNCPVTTQYNPLCGTNRMTYKNISYLNCAKYCGLDIDVLFMGKCQY